jgi:hypothetical protein
VKRFRFKNKLSSVVPYTNKFGNRKVALTTADGTLKFDSNKEYKRYEALLKLQRDNVIKDLRCQVPFELQPAFERDGAKYRQIKYIPDFVYYDNVKQKMIAEDVKGIRTEVYKLKKKLFIYVYGDRYKLLET